MVADFRVQTKNNNNSVTRHFLARNGQCGWQFLKYFVSNQLGKTNTKLSTSVQDLNVCTRMKSGILNHYTIVNIYCYNQYWKVEVGWNGGTMKTKVVQHVLMNHLPPISGGPVDISSFPPCHLFH